VRRKFEEVEERNRVITGARGVTFAPKITFTFASSNSGAREVASNGERDGLSYLYTSVFVGENAMKIALYSLAH